jgi:hypothetical protein
MEEPCGRSLVKISVQLAVFSFQCQQDGAAFFKKSQIQNHQSQMGAQRPSVDFFPITAMEILPLKSSFLNS